MRRNEIIVNADLTLNAELDPGNDVFLCSSTHFRFVARARRRLGRRAHHRPEELPDALDGATHGLRLLLEREHLLVLGIDLHSVDDERHEGPVGGRLRAHVLRIGLQTAVGSLGQATQVDVDVSRVRGRDVGDRRRRRLTRSKFL